MNLFRFNKDKWDKFLKNYQNDFKKIFEFDIDGELVLNIIIIDYLIKISKGKSRFNLIIKKGINALKKKFRKLDEDKINQFRKLIKL